MFEYEATLPKAADETEAQKVTLKFKDYGDAPGSISRYNIGDNEAQIWGYLEWGLEEPKNWPEDSSKPGDSIFDVLPQRQITKAYIAWREADRG